MGVVFFSFLLKSFVGITRSIAVIFSASDSQSAGIIPTLVYQRCIVFEIANCGEEKKKRKGKETD